MTEQTEPTGPPRGSFDWLLPQVEHEFQMPLPKPEPGVDQTLRVVITARATVTPSRLWAMFILTWAGIVGGLLVAIALNTAHGTETWLKADPWKHGSDWGQQEPGRTTTYRDVTGPDGRHHRCAISQWRGEPVMQCD
jgi:hypothetical protein